MANIAQDYSDGLYRILKNKIPQPHYDKYRETGFIVIRCPWCGDSRNSQYHAHMYVKCRVDGNGRPWCYCQRCGAWAHIDSYVLDLLDIYDNDLELISKSYNTELTKRFGGKLQYNNKIKNIKIPMPLNTISVKNKIRYIEDRLGIKIKGKDITKYKIIFNIIDFLQVNRIDKFTRDKRIVEGIDNQYVGFLSINKEYLNCRNTGHVDEYLKRYINYNIFGLDDNTKKFYTLQNVVDCMNDVEIIIAEGPFDIIGIYNHIYNKKDKNRIFVASLGMSCLSLVSYFIKQGFIFCNLKIYADKGVNLSYYRDIKKKLGYKFRGTIEVFYNEMKGEKDFGVRPEQIKLKSYMV